MSIQVHMFYGPLPPAQPLAAPEATAASSFESVVETVADQRPISALVFEDYEPMTQRQLQHLAEQIQEQFDLIAVRVQQSRRRVPVGRCCFRIQAAGNRQPEVVAAIGQFLERMKKDVPLWKMPIWQDHEEAFAKDPNVEHLSRGYWEQANPMT